jgi:hypothetical protein
MNKGGIAMAVPKACKPDTGGYNGLKGLVRIPKFNGILIFFAHCTVHEK